LIARKQPSKTGDQWSPLQTDFGRDIVFSADLCYKLVIKMDELKKRKTPRYQSFDYNSVGVYFITICTQNSQAL
jgi:hypothetical protein